MEGLTASQAYVPKFDKSRKKKKRVKKKAAPEEAAAEETTAEDTGDAAGETATGKEDEEYTYSFVCPSSPSLLCLDCVCLVCA